MDDVKIVPKTIEFKDIDAGSTAEQKIRVINVGKTSKTVRFSPLHSKVKCYFLPCCLTAHDFFLI
jgi:hypothetical protein